MEGMVGEIAASGGAAYSGGKIGFIVSKFSSIFIFIAAGIASIFAMILLEPQGKKEKAICFISTFICAACLSSSIKLYFGIHLPETSDGYLAEAGLIIASGAPGWVIVRAYVLLATKLKGKNLLEIWHMIRGIK